MLGWKKDEWRKQAVGVSLVSPEKRPRTKDEDDWDTTLNTHRGLPARQSPNVRDMEERTAENWSFTFVERCDPDSDGLVVSFGAAINC